ncbi:hypothetical protein [Rhizobium sp. MHM7A]|uniref:hypothetical protein n=1 Tax=Rhizobium sp. MHM7A TaxID=2583233 RepID=UPI0011072F9C|nr:hypothetical protein [Rhizobium sp. MHM7A]TLX17070.1 hypothetical protein FFR93_07085 [Rhizobium sp. MHM7A]
MKTIAFPVVAHIGTMDRSLKDKGSYEGACLSVSIHPGAWSSIARLGGDGFVLSRVDGEPVTFVNATRLSRDEKAAIVDWGKQEGLLVDREVYIASYYDIEDEATRKIECSTREEALAEVEDQPRKRVQGPKLVLGATEKLLTMSDQPISRHEISSDFAYDLVLLAYVEKNLRVDGVWWDETLNVETLSAPRGAIFQDRLDAFEKHPMDFSHMYEEDDLNDEELELGSAPTF